MWKIGRTYTFTPSGDAEEFVLRIVEEVPLIEALHWYENTYKRADEAYIDSTKGFKAILIKGGQDGDMTFRKGSTYYVFDTDYDTTSMYGTHVREVR